MILCKAITGSVARGMEIQGESDVDDIEIHTETVDEHFHPLGNKEAEQIEDSVRYTLSKYMRLLAKQNPNAIEVLFLSPIEAHPEWKNLTTDLRKVAISQEVRKTHLGYLQGQRRRFEISLSGNQSGLGPRRKALADKYGFDVKYGAHMLRLGMQCVDLLEGKSLQMPLAESQLNILMAARTGEMKPEEILRRTMYLEDQVKTMHSPLPAKPNFSAMAELAAATYLRVWTEELKDRIRFGEEKKN